MSLLSIEGLHLAINGHPVLRDVSLRVARGEVLGVIGESGSGKSMCAFSVMQLLPRGAECSGVVRLDGVDVLQAGERQLNSIRGRMVGVVFQEPMTALNPLQSIGDQVAETVRLHEGLSRRAAMQRAREALAKAELPEAEFALSRYPHELSGGQRQRVVIAMAIACGPALLIADEPTTALDVTTQAEILNLLKRLVREEGCGLVLISHDLAVVAGMADRIAIMRAGEVVEQGETGQILHHMRHDYSRALLAASAHQPDRGAVTGDEVLLRCRDVVRDYALPRGGLFAAQQHFRAVDGVSFDIRRGESLGLVGESGCGKSTLTRAILGLEPLQGGRIDIKGQAIAAGDGLHPELRKHMQVVFQDPYGSFNPRHRVERLICEPFHLWDDPPVGAARDRAIAEALEAVGLSVADRHKYPHEFSGGQRQRIAIARALITRPDLIILDEAVSALDVSVRAQVLDLLADLQGRLGLTYLFISHDLSVVRAITDRVMVMKAGRIVEEGETGAVFDAPAHPYTAALIAAAPKLPHGLPDVSGANTGAE